MHTCIHIYIHTYIVMTTRHLKPERKEEEEEEEGRGVTAGGAGGAAGGEDLVDAE